MGRNPALPKAPDLWEDTMPGYFCEVTRAGIADDGEVYIGLRDLDGSFTSRWYKAAPNCRKEMLATALAALSTGIKVDTNLDSSAEYSVVHHLYVSKS